MPEGGGGNRQRPVCHRPGGQCGGPGPGVNDQGQGLLCRLDDNEHDGLESFEATLVDTLEDGTRVYSGPWKKPRPDDPRHFVIAQPPEDKTLVYWGTPKVEDALETNQWPRVYRERHEIQEHSCKRMNDHGALMRLQLCS